MRPRVGIAIASSDANYGLSAALAANYAGAFSRQECALEILAIDRQDRASLAQILRPEFHLLVSYGGWIVSPLDALGQEIRAALEPAGTPLLALIADPVYGSIVAQIMQNVHRRSAWFLIDPSFAHGDRVLGRRPHVRHRSVRQLS